MKHKHKLGFTLVEMLVVIVVVAIIASISIISYNDVQKRARDAKRISDVDQIAKLITLYELNGTTMGAGSGCGNNGNGWFNYQGGTSYPTSMMQCLIDAGQATSEIRDNSVSCSGLSCRAYMKYSCTQNGVWTTYVYANLETKPNTSTDTDGTCSSSIDTSYGMNYWVKI